MADNTVTLEFIARQIASLRETMTTRFDAMDARMAMLQGMLTRLDSADVGLQAELRGVREMVQTHDLRIRRLEEAREA
jgi:hypothetical protein